LLLLEWSDARSAAIYLKPCTPKHLNEEIGTILKRESANRPGTRTARSGGWRYHRSDLVRVREIMDRIGCSPLRAAQHLWAVRRLRAAGVLDWVGSESLDDLYTTTGG